MKVLLKQDVAGHGKKDQIVEVADGYARNFLIPRKLAVVADAAAINQAKTKQEALDHKKEWERNNARELTEKLSQLTVKITATAGPDGRLYGSVTTANIADALEKEHGVKIDKKKIVMEDPIKNFGTYTLGVKVYPETAGKITVVVADK